MTRPVTAWEVGEQSADKPLRRFGSASMTRTKLPALPRVSVRPARLNPKIWGEVE